MMKSDVCQFGKFCLHTYLGGARSSGNMKSTNMYGYHLTVLHQLMSASLVISALLLGVIS